MKHLLSLSAALASFTALPAWAQDNLRIDGLEVIGAPVDGEMGFQPAVTRLAQDIHEVVACMSRSVGSPEPPLLALSSPPLKNATLRRVVPTRLWRNLTITQLEQMFSSAGRSPRTTRWNLQRAWGDLQ